MKKHTPSDLAKLYSAAESCDKKTFAEMRSNILLIAGEHYAKKGSKFWNRIRDDKSLTEEAKLRIVKNHVQKICKIYSNQILASAPGVMIGPQNEKERKDQKAAEIHQAVWSDWKRKNNWGEKVSNWTDAMVGVSEVHTKIYFDPNKGHLKGYEQEIDQDRNLIFVDAAGNDTLMPQDEMGNPHQPKQSQNPVMSGQLVAKDYFGFNVLRCPTAQTIDDSPYIVLRSMVDVDFVLAQIPEEKKEAREKIRKEASGTYQIFDAANGDYDTSANQCLYKEFYFRPSIQYPQGWFYHMVADEVLFEGELPGGIFPIVSECYETVPTNPRGVGPVRTMRPYQLEINRTSSKVAETHISLGDDKVIMKKGSKLEPGHSVPGVRSMTISGPDPTVIPGRDGAQFLPWLQANIAELYSVMMVDELNMPENGQLEPMALIFRSGAQKQKFKRNIARMERFQTRVCEVVTALSKIYLTEDELRYIIGAKEAVNLAEYYNADPLCYQIKTEQVSEDMESKLGKQLALNTLLQYGQNLSKEEIGQIVRLMPYTNGEQLSSDLTLDYDNATNVILALDRGEVPLFNKRDKHEYMIAKLTKRMRESDFTAMDPKIQANYEQRVEQHEQQIAMNIQELKIQQSQLIPTTGPLVGIDFYVSDPKNPEKTRRGKVPSDALRDLIDKLEAQGTALQMEGLDQENLASVAGHLNRSQAGAAPTDGGASANHGAAEMAQGVASGRHGRDIGGPSQVRPGRLGGASFGTGAGAGAALPRLSRIADGGFDPRSIGAAASPGR